MKKRVLILCTGNSCRSIIAEALINHRLGDKWIACSAGVEPSKVNPRAIEVMSEIGIDISSSRSKSVDEFLIRDDLDLVITVCDHARETCPVFPSKVKQIHLGFEDPAPFTDEIDEIALPKFREVRDDIAERLIRMLKDEKISD
ncbi:MAG: arsenate reductase ArsC [Candidatus Electryonea clarkiae]|nr:arsenate reductase ArsC [Candidatus Electryonea clarkiae]MDP8285518.1 arsenate reductase ArsC [Candidatus Electryonea clarkiae]